MATNRADTLDPALLRPGRLDRKIEFPLPDRRQKRLVFQVCAKLLSDTCNMQSMLAIVGMHAMHNAVPCSLYISCNVCSLLRLWPCCAGIIVGTCAEEVLSFAPQMLCRCMGCACPAHPVKL